jgi:hypothetical protein
MREHRVARYAEGANLLSWSAGTRMAAPTGELCLAQTRISEYICPHKRKTYARRMGGGLMARINK